MSRGRWLVAIPILGWLYIAWGFVWPFRSPVLVSLWWIDLLVSVVGHGLQIPRALPVGRRAGHSGLRVVCSTFLLGATYWARLDRRRFDR